MVRAVRTESLCNEPHPLESPRGARPLRDSLRSSAVGLRCLRRPGGTERRSPFQSARDGRWTSRRPGGLKGRGQVREARRRKHCSERGERSAQRAARLEPAEGFRGPYVESNAHPDVRSIHIRYLSLRSPRTTRCAICSMTPSTTVTAAVRSCTAPPRRVRRPESARCRRW